MWIDRKCLLYLVCLFSQSISYATDFIVESEFMELKTAAGRSQAVFLVVEKNEPFSVLKKKYDWVKIKTKNGESGWVSLKEFASATGGFYSEKENFFRSKIEIGASTGNFSNEESYLVGIGYYVKPEILFSIDALRAAGSYSSSTLINANVALKFYRRRLVSPFISIGAGSMLNKPRQSLVNANESRQMTYNYGGGIGWNAYKNMSLRFSVREFYLTDAGKNYFNWNIGVFGFFS